MHARFIAVMCKFNACIVRNQMQLISWRFKVFILTGIGLGCKGFVTNFEGSSCAQFMCCLYTINLGQLYTLTILT